MAFNGSGVFIRLFSWVTDKANTVPVTASRMDSEMDGFATGLSTCITRNGQTTTSDRIPFASGTAAAAGSVSSVSYGHTGDDNTGLYFPASDEWGLSAGGTDTLRSTATVVTVKSGVTLAMTTGTKGGNALDAFPSGTKLVFQQTAAPTGWTKQSTHNDKALRVVSGTVGSGGSVAFSTCFARTTTDNFTIAQANLPNVNFTVSGVALNDPGHLHNMGVTFTPVASGVGAQGISAGAVSTLGATTGITIASQGTAASGGSGTALNAGMDIRVQFVDVTICAKD